MPKVKLSLIILIVLIAISLSFAGSGFYLLQKERQKNIQLQGQLDELSTKQRMTENKLEDTKRAVSDLQLRVQEANLQIDTLSDNLEQEKTAKVEALGRIEQLRIDLEQQKELRTDLEKRLNQAQEELSKTQDKSKQLESQKTGLEAKIKELEAKSQGVELGKIVVSPETPAIKPAAKKAAKESKPVTKKKEKPTPAQVQVLEGKVLVVNKDYNFVVINLGTTEGVSLDQVFSVYHGNKYLGDVKIEKVHDAMSAAGFASGDLKDKVSEGDKVVQKGK